MYSPSEFSRTTTTSIGRVAAQRTGHAGKGARRACARVEVERLAKPDERREGDVVWQTRGPTYGTQEDGIEAAQRREEVVGGDPPVPVIVRDAPVERLVRQHEVACLSCDRVEHGDRGVDDLWPNAVAGIQRDAVRVHGRIVEPVGA